MNPFGVRTGEHPNRQPLLRRARGRHEDHRRTPPVQAES